MRAKKSSYKRSYTIQTVEQALDILEAISDIKGEICLAILSKQLDINKSSLFRFITTFEKRGYLESSKISGRYRVGVSAVETSSKLIFRMDYLKNAKQAMELLAHECNEDVYLAIPLSNEILMLDAVPSKQKIQIAPLIGKRFPLGNISSGKLFMAYKQESTGIIEQREIIEQHIIIDHESIGEGVSNIAVPISNFNNELVGYLCLIGPTFRFPMEVVKHKFLPNMQRAGHDISSKLGYVGRFY